MDFQALADVNDGFKASRILQAAVELGVFEATREPVDAAGLAQRLEADRRGVRILADALCALGLLDKEDGAYEQAEVARRFLDPDADAYFGHMVGFDAMNWPTWGRLEDAVRTGEPQREPMYQDDRVATERFIKAMVSIGIARGDADVLPERVELDGAERLLDVGGGPGHFTRAFLEADPDLEAVLFDLPGTLAVTRELLEDWGPERDRLTLVEGDYLEDELPSCDACLLSNILHGEPPERCKRLIDRLGDAIEPGGRLVIKDHVPRPDGTEPEIAALFAVDMLLFTGGDCYTLERIRMWLEDAGFAQIRETPPEAPLTSSLVTARKV